jgi:hypothetical protein
VDRIAAVESEYPFPFFGAGEATYFEWAEVNVRFVREPSADERAAIDRRVPPPLRPAEDEEDEVWRGPLLNAGSDQHTHMWIIEHYRPTTVTRTTSTAGCRSPRRRGCGGSTRTSRSGCVSRTAVPDPGRVPG